MEKLKRGRKKSALRELIEMMGPDDFLVIKNEEVRSTPSSFRAWVWIIGASKGLRLSVRRDSQSGNYRIAQAGVAGW